MLLLYSAAIYQTEQVWGGAAADEAEAGSHAGGRDSNRLTRDHHDHAPIEGLVVQRVEATEHAHHKTVKGQRDNAMAPGAP